jgi:hypothetical protein
MGLLLEAARELMAVRIKIFPRDLALKEKTVLRKRRFFPVRR